MSERKHPTVTQELIYKFSTWDGFVECVAMMHKLGFFPPPDHPPHKLAMIATLYKKTGGIYTLNKYSQFNHIALNETWDHAHGYISIEKPVYE